MANEGSGVTRILRRTTAGTLACLLGVTALAGCTLTELPTPSPTPTGIFSSEEEALAAATDVFASYLAAYDSSMSAGGKDLSKVRDFVGEKYFAELSVPGTIVENNWHTEGVSTFEVIRVADYDASADPEGIALNICRDVSTVRVLNSSNQEVTPPERKVMVPLTVSFVRPSEESVSNQPLVVSKVESWASSDQC